MWCLHMKRMARCWPLPIKMVSNCRPHTIIRRDRDKAVHVVDFCQTVIVILKDEYV